MKQKGVLKNEDGSILVLALIMLMLLTVLGISVTTTSNIEIQVAGNEKFYKESLYLAEAAALEYAQEMEDDPNLGYILQGTSINVHDEDDWTSYSDESAVEDIVDLDDDPTIEIDYIAVYEGIAPGASLDMTGAQVHQYTVYARCKRNKAVAIVKVGYRKAF